MSIAENLESHKDEISKEMQRVHELMKNSETGRKTIEASAAMAKSGLMQDLLEILSHESIPEEERESNTKYLADLLQLDPEDGMKLFAASLYDSMEIAKQQDRVDYYMLACKATMDLAESAEYKDYVIANQNFEKDTSAVAAEARRAMKAMHEKAQKWTAK